MYLRIQNAFKPGHEPYNDHGGDTWTVSMWRRAPLIAAFKSGVAHGMKTGHEPYNDHGGDTWPVPMWRRARLIAAFKSGVARRMKTGQFYGKK